MHSTASGPFTVELHCRPFVKFFAAEFATPG